jgi:transposase InsO family protein/transposase
MARRKFTREFKVSAVKLVNEQGYSVPQAAKSLGVDPSSVRYWVGKLSGEAALSPKGGRGRGGRASAPAQGERASADGTGHFKKSGRVLCQGEQVKFAWIDEHRERWEASRMCRVLEVSRSGYYDWRDRRNDPHPSELRRRKLLGDIRAEQELGRGVYGAPRVHAGLVARGVKVCLNTVAKLMKDAGIRSQRAARFRVRTTDSRHDHPPAPNLLDRQFDAGLPDQKWLCDITYIPTKEGMLYLAGVLDVCSRKIVGWSMGTSLAAGLCLDALGMALRRRRPQEGLLHHSDRGVQYACEAYRQLLEDNGVTRSMSRSGDCYDNAMMESFHSTLKGELVHLQPDGRFEGVDQARRMVFEFIEVFYNRQRRHSAIGYVSPEQFEASLN